MRASSSSLPDFTARSSEVSMRLRPADTAASLMSQTVTAHPALAETSAIPAPMSPAPTTPTRSMPSLIVLVLLGRRPRSGGSPQCKDLTHRQRPVGPP